MTFSTASVPLDRIDGTDLSFQITTPTPLEPLKRAIDRVGVISPPLLFPKDPNTCGIVCGFRRIAACRELGHLQIHARIAAHAERSALAELAIADNAMQRPLNPVEISRALHLLSADHETPKSLCEAGRALGLDIGMGLIQKLLLLRTLPLSIQEGVIEESLPLPIALELGELGEKAGTRFAAIFSDLRPSLNKEREILTLMREIGKIEERSLPELLDDSKIDTILSDESADRNQRLNHFRTHLRKRRYPAITRAQKQYAEHLADLKPGPGLSLIPPRDFEGTTYTLTLQFASVADLRSRWEQLSRLLDHPAMTAILRRNS